VLIVGLVLGLAAALVALALRGSFRVEEGELAVLTRFGAAVTEPPGSHVVKTFGPGLHFRWPWLAVHKVPMREQTLDLTGARGGLRAMASDGTELRIDSILRFTPVKSDLHHFLFELEDPLEHVKALFTCLLRNEIANFHPDGGRDDAEGRPYEGDGSAYARLRGDRRALNERIQSFCSGIGKRYGIRFDAVDLTDILPPDELQDALNAVMHARAEADGAFARAQAECQRQVVAAERGVEVARTRARATEEEIEVLAGHLAELERAGTLARYVERRRQEVVSQSRALFLRTR
jgi:regulator of protease activity HflC (stomatin/prohibitin superfamily)